MIMEIPESIADYKELRLENGLRIAKNLQAIEPPYMWNLTVIALFYFNQILPLTYHTDVDSETPSSESSDGPSDNKKWNL